MPIKFKLKRPKLTLMHKLILTHVGVIGVLVLALLVLFIAFNRTLAERLFEDAQTHLMETMAVALERHHVRHGDWAQLAKEPQVFSRFVEFALRHNIANKFMPLVSEPSPAPNGVELVVQSAEPFVDYIVGKFRLYGADQQLILGHEHPGGVAALGAEYYHTREILAGQRVIGLLVLDTRFELQGIIFDRAINRQVMVLVMVVIVGTILAIFASIWFSRTLTTPLRSLQRVTARIANRHFDERVHVNTRDELGSLAISINAMAESLAGYERRQKQWLEDVAHELRTPMMIVMGELEAMADGVSPVTPESLSALRQDMQRLTRLVSDLGELARLEGEGFSCACEPIDLKASLEEAVNRFRGRMSDNDLTVELKCSESIMVSADADRFSQIWANLLENAVRYVTSPGSVCISAQVHGAMAEVLFDDSGPGVPPEVLPRLFDRLFRVEASRNRAFGGSGLGLSLCALIVKRHDGEMSAQINPNGGLRLRIVLPTL